MLSNQNNVIDDGPNGSVDSEANENIHISDTIHDQLDNEDDQLLVGEEHNQSSPQTRFVQAHREAFDQKMSQKHNQNFDEKMLREGILTPNTITSPLTHSGFSQNQGLKYNRNQGLSPDKM